MAMNGELSSYSSDLGEIIENEDGTYIKIHQAECNPRPVEDWFTWDINFQNMSRIDVTNTFLWLVAHGYRVYDDVYKKWKENPVGISFMATRQGVITLFGFENKKTAGQHTSNEASVCPSYEKFIKVTSLQQVCVLGIQRVKPKDWTEQIIWVYDKVRGSKFMTICRAKTVEEHLHFLGVTSYEYWRPTAEDLLVKKRLQVLNNRRWKSVKATCKIKKDLCICCDRASCKVRNKVENAPVIKKEKKVLTAEDLL